MDRDRPSGARLSYVERSEDVTTDIPSRIGIAYLIVQQIGGIVGGVGLGSLLAGLAAFDWHGLPAELISAWDQYVRPVSEYILNAGIAVPLAAWFDIHVSIPAPVHDYLSVGLVLTLSDLRADVWAGTRRGLGFLALVGHLLWQFLSLNVLSNLLAWPYQVARLATVATTGRSMTGAEMSAITRVACLLALSPLAYLFLLLLMNFIR